MDRHANVIGQMVAKLRYQRGWKQDDLVAKLQLLGCYMTRDILANIETRRSIATDKQIEFFVEVFGVSIKDLFPPLRSSTNGSINGRFVGIADAFPTRRPSRTQRGKSHA